MRSGLGAVLATVLLAAPAIAARTPLAPPAVAPVSRLTVTPSEFERWLAARPAERQVVETPDELPPSRVTPPPPPPRLVTPPPPPPKLPGAPRGTATTGTPPAPPVLEPPAPPQVATLPPDSPANTPGSARPGVIRILYAADATVLPETAHGDLDKIAAWLRANPSVRVQIVGYASQTEHTGSEARRRSLFRTLAVRTYLIENGVLSTRMDVRAMGFRTGETPKDRVEVRLPPT